jgi:hypothetical protein
MPPASYEPRPIDTSRVQLSPELQTLVERLAENAHEIWAQRRMRDGWHYGPLRNDDRREHPSLVPYAELDETEKEYDRAMVRGAIGALLALGYRIEPN